MKTLYIGQLQTGGTCLARAEALRAKAWDIIPFDTVPYLNVRRRLSRAIQLRIHAGPAVSRFNQDLLAFVRQHKDANLIWIDKGLWVLADTLHAIKTLCNAILVHYTPDPAFTYHTSRHFRRGLAYYDICITTKRYELGRYRESGARRVMFTWQGIDDRFTTCQCCTDVTGAHRSGAVFIGHREAHYERLLGAIALDCRQLRVSGPGWERLAKRATPLAACVSGSGIWGRVYVETLGGARIGIGLLSKLCPDQFTTRSFEIPAAGALLLAERTEDHLALFEEDKEAVFFSTTHELRQKLRHYLANDTERAAIAERGRQKALACYQWSDVLAPALQEIERLSASR